MWKKRAFPAYAGMNRPADSKRSAERSVPRVCGDEPIVSELPQPAVKRSPRMRG